MQYYFFGCCWHFQIPAPSELRRQTPLGLRQSKFCHSDNYLLLFSSFIFGSQILGATCPPATRFDCVRLTNLIELNLSIKFDKVWLSNCPSGCVRLTHKHTTAVKKRKKKWCIFTPFNVFTKFDISARGVDTFSAYSAKKRKNNNKNRQTNKTTPICTFTGSRNTQSTSYLRYPASVPPPPPPPPVPITHFHRWFKGERGYLRYGCSNQCTMAAPYYR